MIIGGTRVQLEARLTSPRWLVVVVPVFSVLFALVVGGVFLLLFLLVILNKHISCETHILCDKFGL